MSLRMLDRHANHRAFLKLVDYSQVDMQGSAVQIRQLLSGTPPCRQHEGKWYLPKWTPLRMLPGLGSIL